MIRIGYGKKTKKRNLMMMIVYLFLVRGFLSKSFKMDNPLYDEENARRHCAGGSIANLLYHPGEMPLYCSILLSMNQTEVGAVYKIATGCILNDSVYKTRCIVEGHFRDPIMKCLWILELSEKYSFQNLNIEIFAMSRDTMINAKLLVLPTILALTSSHNMRFEEQSKVPGNHVTCYWQGQIIDYGSKQTYPLTLNNLHFTCGETLQFEGN